MEQIKLLGLKSLPKFGLEIMTDEERNEFLDYIVNRGRPAEVTFYAIMRDDFISVFAHKRLSRDKHDYISEVWRAYKYGATFCDHTLRKPYIGCWNVSLAKSHNPKGAAQYYGYSYWGKSKDFDEESEKFLSSTLYPFSYIPQCFKHFTEEQYRAWLLSAVPNGIDLSKNKTRYIERFVGNLPASEMLFKNGYRKLSQNYQICHPEYRHGEDPFIRQKLIRWISGHKEEVKKLKTVDRIGNIHYRPMENVIFECAEFNCSPSELEFKERANSAKITASEQAPAILNAVKKFFGNNFEKVVRYCDEQKFGIDDYFELLSDEYKAGISLEDKGAIKPLDLKAQREAVSAALSEFSDSKVKEIAEALGMQKVDDEIKIRPLKTSKQFVEIGNKLHNCVGRMGYFEKMSEAKTYVAVLFVKGKPEECCEIGKAGEILQLYGDHNTNTGEYHELAKAAFKRYAEERKEIFGRF